MALPLKDNAEGKKILATELYRRFHAMKTYGKEPESLENIIAVFTSDLENYSIEKVMKAIKFHSQRSQEFPTIYDIVNLIKRGGKPPLSEAMFISISRKDYEDRTPEEHRYFREYQEEMQDGWNEKPEPVMKEVRFDEQERLRKEVYSLREENAKLAKLLHEARMSKGLEKPKPSEQEKIDKTLEYLKQTGASQKDIDDFLSSVNQSKAA